MKQIKDSIYLKPVRPGGHIYGRDVGDVEELSVVVVTQEQDGRDDAIWVDVDLQLISMTHLNLVSISI